MTDLGRDEPAGLPPALHLQENLGDDVIVLIRFFSPRANRATGESRRVHAKATTSSCSASATGVPLSLLREPQRDGGPARAGHQA